MNLEKIQIQNKSDLDFLEKLYIDSFPIDERRPLSKMIDLIENDDRFDVFIVLNEDKQKVGFITQWNLETVLFLEHFAISSDYRNGGYGKVVLKTLINNTDLPIVGEIELPEISDMATRRKSFYEKVGFKVWDIEYVQPPLGAGQSSIPMLLITFGSLNTEIERIKHKLYTEVYCLEDLSLK